MNETLTITKTKRPKYGGRKALDPLSKTAAKRITDKEYELIKTLRAKHLLDMCLDFAMSN